jgi:hypothetical protein
MANEKHLALLRQGAGAWNAWRKTEGVGRPDLRGAVLPEAKLAGANLGRADLSEANLGGADLSGADLSRAILDRAILAGATLTKANLTGAILPTANLIAANLDGATLAGANLGQANLGAAKLGGADLKGANLSSALLQGTNLSGADLGGANLELASLVGTDLTGANLTGCRVFGVSAWQLKLDGSTRQHGLVITQRNESEITTDDMEVAQFVYLLLHNEKIRDAIDTVGKKGVLLLGRFTDDRITILEKLRDALRKRDFVPIIFNFDKPETRDFTETIRILAGMSRFVIVDITRPRSTPLELQALVPDYMMPFVPIIQDGEEPFAMFRDLWIKYDKWVLQPIIYTSIDRLIERFDDMIIKRAQDKFAELQRAKTLEIPKLKV